MRDHFEGYDTWRTGHTPWDDWDEWDLDEIDKEEFYNSLCSWKKDEVDALETDEEKDELMHKYWLEKCRDDWEAMNDWGD